MTLVIPSARVTAADWQSDYWPVVPSTFGSEKRSAPIRTVVEAANGVLLGTRPSLHNIELWSSANNGVDWSRMGDLAFNASVFFGDSTLTVLDSGEILAGFRELHPTLGWSVRVSRSVDHGQTWSFGGTVHDWTHSENQFVGAPYFNTLSDGSLQVYYDSEYIAPGSHQYIAVKDGAFNPSTQLWEWSNERVVNTMGVGGAGIRDGMPTVVNLGPDSTGSGDRLMVVTEAIGFTGGQAHNLIRAFQVGNGGATQADWNNLLDSRVIYQSPHLDPQGHRYNAYAPFAIQVGDGPVLVGFSTDEGLHSVGGSADIASTPPHLRHSEIKVIQTLGSYESWSNPITVWGPDHPQFVGDYQSGDIRNYQIGLVELHSDDVLGVLDLFGGRQVVFRPALGGLTADFDRDGVVDGHDFLAWQRGFGGTGQPIASGDATGEGTINAADLAIWKQQFATYANLTVTAAAVPEPSAMMLAILVTGFWSSRRVPRNSIPRIY